MARKAQGALEYLITYGWAILIIVIIGGALFALGVFNPATWGSNKRATGFSSIQVNDWKVNSSGLSLVIANKFGDTISLTNVTATLSGQTTVCWTNATAIPAAGVSLTSDGTAALNSTNVNNCLPSPYAQGKTYTMAVSAYFSSGSLTHVDTGTLTGKYE
jgi:hypothetical protein